MIYTTKYINGGSVEELSAHIADFFEDSTNATSMVIDNIAYMQEMKVNRLNPQIPMVEFSCIIIYTP